MVLPLTQEPGAPLPNQWREQPLLLGGASSLASVPNTSVPTPVATFNITAAQKRMPALYRFTAMISITNPSAGSLHATIRALLAGSDLVDSGGAAAILTPPALAPGDKTTHLIELVLSYASSVWRIVSIRSTNEQGGTPVVHLPTINEAALDASFSVRDPGGDVGVTLCLASDVNVTLVLAGSSASCNPFG